MVRARIFLHCQTAKSASFRIRKVKLSTFLKIEHFCDDKVATDTKHASVLFKITENIENYLIVRHSKKENNYRKFILIERT